MVNTPWGVWFFRLDLWPALIFGIFFLLISKPYGNRVIKKKPDSFFSIPIINKIFIVWTGWAMGIGAIGAVLHTGINRPCGGIRGDEDRLVLLEQGEITEGKIVKCWYDKEAPAGWEVLYSFKISNPRDGKAKTYWGTAWGPKKYYADFSEDDSVMIIYNPLNPKMNCEIYFFLNNPNYRYTFREAGKLELLNKFRDEYRDMFENYSVMRWHNEAKQK